MNVELQNQLPKIEGVHKLSRVMRNSAFAYAKIKAQISCMITASDQRLAFATHELPKSSSNLRL